MSITIVQNRFGGPEVLEVIDVEPPTGADLGPDEVLVRVAFAGVNTGDVPAGGVSPGHDRVGDHVRGATV